MEFPPSQLSALLAIADHGTFEAAARHLHLTPSAVSQRVRALESSIGQVVLQRATPCRPTAAGETLLRLARQTQLLYDEASDVLVGGDRSQVTLPLAVNADSLATWFRVVLGEIAGWPDVAVQLHLEDQAWSADLLRRGDVLAAVTSEPEAVQGCSVERLGTLRHVPAASPGLVERWRRGRGVDWAAMPVVVFNQKDALQHDVLRARDVTEPPVVHLVPTSADFVEAVRLGLGWGAVPEPQLRPGLADGTLMALPGGGHIDVPLHWQRWRLDSPVLTRVTDVVRSAALAQLRR